MKLNQMNEKQLRKIMKEAKSELNKKKKLKESPQGNIFKEMNSYINQNIINVAKDRVYTYINGGMPEAYNDPNDDKVDILKDEDLNLIHVSNNGILKNRLIKVIKDVVYNRSAFSAYISMTEFINNEFAEYVITQGNSEGLEDDMLLYIINRLEQYITEEQQQYYEDEVDSQMVNSY